MQKKRKIKPAEAAKYIGYSVNSLQNLDNAGKLPAHRTPTNRRYYYQDELMQFVNNKNNKEKEFIDLMKYTKPLPFNTFQYIYDHEFTPEKLKHILDNTEIKPLLIIGQDGNGKMSLMRQFAQDYQDKYTTLLVKSDLLMGDSAQNIETVFKEAIASQKGNEHDLVIVMDECHQLFLQNTKICQLYNKYNEKLSEARIHLIGLTTKNEFTAFIKIKHILLDNTTHFVQFQPLPDDTIYRILKAKLDHYHIYQNTETDKVLNALMALPVPDNKSKLRYTIDLLYQMIGWHRAWNKNINQQLLNSVIQANTK